MVAFLLSVFSGKARTLKGCGKRIFPRRRGDSEAKRNARGALAPMEICKVNLGSRPKAGALLGEVAAPPQQSS
jgi:hypothetical protein